MVVRGENGDRGQNVPPYIRPPQDKGSVNRKGCDQFNVSADSSGRLVESIFVLEHTLQPGWELERRVVPIRQVSHLQDSAHIPELHPLSSQSGSSELGSDLHKWLDCPGWAVARYRVITGWECGDGGNCENVMIVMTPTPRSSPWDSHQMPSVCCLSLVTFLRPH